MNIGYIRVSCEDQNIDRQLEGVSVDKTFIDRLSGIDINRHQYQLMLEFIREGDTLFVHSMDRLSRNLDDLRSIVQILVSKGIKVKFVKENLVFTGEDSAMSILLLSLMGAFAEFERAIIRERQKEGIDIAKKKGLYKGRKRSLNPSQIEELKIKISNGNTKTSVAREYKISRRAVYNYI